VCDNINKELAAHSDSITNTMTDDSDGDSVARNDNNNSGCPGF